jgi:hypothetical protein
LSRGLGFQFPFGFAHGAAGLWGVESDETHIWSFVVKTDRVPVDDTSGIYRCGDGHAVERRRVTRVNMTIKANLRSFRNLVDGASTGSPDWALSSQKSNNNGEVYRIAAGERHALAHFHERLAAWALRRRRFQAGLGLVLVSHHPHHSALSRSIASASFVQVWAIEIHRVRTCSSVAVSSLTWTTAATNAEQRSCELCHAGARVSRRYQQFQSSLKLALSTSSTALSDALCASSWYATVGPRSTQGSL